MSYEIKRLPTFDRQVKRLAKKYASLKTDLKLLFDSLQETPDQGAALGKSCYKIRIAIASKKQGKSGGARVITFVKVTQEAVYLLAIYDKSEKEDLADGNWIPIWMLLTMEYQLGNQPDRCPSLYYIFQIHRANTLKFSAFFQLFDSPCGLNQNALNGIVMKRFMWTIALVAGSLTASGQQTEFLVQAGSGLFGFRGPGAARETTLLVTDYSDYHALENPYGRSSGFSYSLTGQVQRITTHGLLYGIQAGFESLTSRVTITLVSGGLFFPFATNDPATLRNQYLNLHPFVGRRFSKKRFSLDATAGIDLGTILTERLRSETSSTAGSYATLFDTRPAPSVDLRPRVNLTGYYRAFGLGIGYAQGLTNYPNAPFSNDKTYSRFWRVGLVYRLGRLV